MLRARSPVTVSSAIRELKEHLQYRFDEVFARGSGAQFLLIFVLALVVVAFGMSAACVGLFSDPNTDVEGITRDIDGGFWDTLWWSMKHIFDPMFFSLDYGATLPVVIISLLVTIMG